MSDQSRFTTADAALERNPLTTPAMAPKTPVKTQETTRPGEKPSAPVRSAHSLAGYEDAEAGAHAPRRSAATSSAATVAPPLPAAIGRSGTANKWGGSLLQRKIQREREAAIWGGGEARKQGAPRSRTGSARNHQESELFSRSGRGERGRNKWGERDKRCCVRSLLRLPPAFSPSLISWGFRGRRERSA